MSKNTIENCIRTENIADNIFDKIYPSIYNTYLASIGAIYKYISIPNYIYVRIVQDNINKLYTYDYMELLFAISKENVNPSTGEPFNTENYNNLSKKYTKEIKLIKRYFKGKNITS